MNQYHRRDQSLQFQWPQYHHQQNSSELTNCSGPSQRFSYNFSIAILVLTVAFLISLATCKPALPVVATEQIPNLSQYPVLIVISYDGFRYNFFEGKETPAMDEIGYNGVRVPLMKNQFPTKTFPNHQSIATGLHPESHGITENHVFDPEYGQALGAQDEKFWVFRDDVVPAWIVNEWAGGNRTSGTMMWPGCEYGYGANKSHPTFHQAYNTSIPYDIRIETILSWVTHPQTPANLVFVHFEEPDATAHAWGPNSTQTTAVIELMDNVTAHLIERLKQMDLFDKVNLMLLSDHGFHGVRARDIINITDRVDPMDPKYGYKSYGGSPVLNVAPVNDDKQVLDTLYARFQEASKGRNFTVYKRSELNQVKGYWHFYNNRRIMPLVLVADPGYVFDDFYDEIQKYYAVPPYNHTFNLNATYGTHGYDNHDMSMHPFFMAHGPLFYSDGREVESFENIDLFPLFAHVAEFEPPASNGTHNAIKFILRKERHSQFHLGAQGVGWIVVIAVIFGLMILTVILSFLKQKQPRSDSLLKPNSGSNAGYRFVNTKGDYEDEDYFEESETTGLVAASNSDYDDEENLDARFVNVTHADAAVGKIPDYIHVQDFRKQEPDTSTLNTNVIPLPPTSVDTSQSSNHVDKNMNRTPTTSINMNMQPSSEASVPPLLLNMLDDEDVEEFQAPIASKSKRTPGRTYRVTFA